MKKANSRIRGYWGFNSPESTKRNTQIIKIIYVYIYYLHPWFSIRYFIPGLDNLYICENRLIRNVKFILNIEQNFTFWNFKSWKMLFGVISRLFQQDKRLVGKYFSMKQRKFGMDEDQYWRKKLKNRSISYLLKKHHFQKSDERICYTGY